MTLTEILQAFKTRFNPSKVMNSLERAVDFHNESYSNSEGINSGEDLKNRSTKLSNQ